MLLRIEDKEGDGMSNKDDGNLTWRYLINFCYFTL